LYSSHKTDGTLTPFRSARRK